MWKVSGGWVLGMVFVLGAFTACAPANDVGEPASDGVPKSEPAYEGVREVSQAEIAALLEAGDSAALLDVRTAEEFESGHLPGAINIPVGELADRLGELEAAREHELIVYCRSGRRASRATALLERAGFTRLGHLEGDMLGWNEAGLPVE